MKQAAKLAADVACTKRGQSMKPLTLFDRAKHGKDDIESWRHVVEVDRSYVVDPNGAETNAPLIADPSKD